MAPVTFITFGLKHHVDSILLTKLYAFRDDNTVTLGDYPPHVAHHMYSTVAWTMMIQAAGAVLFMTVGASPEERFNSVWIWSLAKLLVALGAVLLPLSFWNAWQVDKKENFPDQPEEREHLHAPVLLRLARRTVDVVHEFIVASPYGGGREPLLPDGGARADPAGAAADGPGHGGHDGSEELSWNATKCFADAVLRRTPLRSEPGPGLDAHGSPEVVDWPALAGKLCGLLGGKVVSTDGMPMRFERAIRRSGDDLDDDGMVVDLPALLEGPACWSAP
ncbi:unnamed protein product [Prorocentrum cordatum]|uniref:Uncharacterized protein n=1 Tax=Prorocentrum cordatum TaxID=2364126 RepID=A0ABN9QBS0_9DINO|nr:unnamed protein product [Polarella glacialis]